jgi:anti-anti-sigma regulatory factor
MKQIIKLYDIYHADLFSRAKASILAEMISPEADTVILDFEGITFMSRSFTDELYNIVITYPDKTFSYTGRNEDIRAMMEKVAEGRTRERQLGIPPAQMLSFDSQSKLAEFLVVQ